MEGKDGHHRCPGSRPRHFHHRPPKTRSDRYPASSDASNGSYARPPMSASTVSSSSSSGASDSPEGEYECESSPPFGRRPAIPRRIKYEHSRPVGRASGYPRTLSRASSVDADCRRLKTAVADYSSGSCNATSTSGDVSAPRGRSSLLSLSFKHSLDFDSIPRLVLGGEVKRL